MPAHCRVEYCDVVSREDLLSSFPEVDPETVVEVDHLCDMDTQGLTPFADDGFDFVILNHVIEHVANPIAVVGEVFRVAAAPRATW